MAATAVAAGEVLMLLPQSRGRVDGRLRRFPGAAKFSGQFEDASSLFLEHRRTGAETMTRSVQIAAVTLTALSAGLADWSCQAATDSENASPEDVGFRLRSDVETALPAREEAFQADPGDDDARRAYADILYKLGNVWEAEEVIKPLGSAGSSNAGDLQLAAELAYLLGDYGQAEILFGRLMELAEAGSEDRAAAVRGLVLTWYQTNQFARARELPETDEGDDGASKLLAFMQAFEGEPYGIQWATDDRIAIMEMTGDITRPGALPVVELNVNGQPLSLILDTGGDRLYLDNDVYASLGIPTLTTREARYAYTGGRTVEEPLGAAETVKMGDVTLTNVPVVGATWKALGQTSDGILTTQMLKQFLSTMDYDNLRITLRERTPEALAQVMEGFGDTPPVEVPFYMSKTHLMFAKGVLNGRTDINYFLDSGLAMSMPLIVVDETTELLGLETNPIEGTQYYWTSIESHGLNGLVKGATQAMGNVFVEENPFWQSGFMMDALISHQYLWPLGSWTIDFDNMTYYFPDQGSER